MAFYDEHIDQSAFHHWVGPNPSDAFNVFARAYRSAADCVAESLLERVRFASYEAYPVVFLYRHAFELSVKHAIYKSAELAEYHNVAGLSAALDNSHDLERLAGIARKALLAVFPRDTSLVRMLSRISRTSREFAALDPSSFVFRYPIDTRGRDSRKRNCTISLRLLATHMSAVLEDLDTINFALNNTASEAQDAFTAIFEAALQS